MTLPQDYKTFLSSKRLDIPASGIQVNPAALHPRLFAFQRAITSWALARGKAAIFATTGLGKTLMQVSFARHIKGTVLLVAPLAVSQQTIAEGATIAVPIRYVRTASDLQPGVNITNYERLDAFMTATLDGLILDESSILKSLYGKTKTKLFALAQSIPYRLCCTATPCPNDIAEIANHAQVLGIMTREALLSTFFVHDDEGWRLRGHARTAFYRWLTTWSMALNTPEDIGFDGSKYRLPPLTIREQVVASPFRRSGELFAAPLHGITDRIAVRRQTIAARVEAAVALAQQAEGPCIVWCGLNAEAEAMAQALGSEAINVQGADTLEQKEAGIAAFVRGEVRILISKARICGFGMNFQHAATAIFLGLNDSYEQYFQCIRRIWRFGQQRPVTIHVVVSEHETDIVTNIHQKEQEATRLMDHLIAETAAMERAILHAPSSQEQTQTLARHSETLWEVWQGDCVESMGQMPAASIDFSVYSPPFLSLYQYSDTDRDLGNSHTVAQFFAHFRYVADGLLRLTRPGRLTAMHLAQVPAMLVKDGYIGLKDFRGPMIALMEEAGWIYHGDITIDKNPQAQAIRVKNKALLFAQLRKDSSWLRPAMADYLLVFRKPGTNAVPILPTITNEQWIQWAHPVWYGIRESNTLNAAVARGADDERHICPLQLDLIERCIQLWSNEGETIFDPFAGIGSTGYVALQHGRRFVGCELKECYVQTMLKNLHDAQTTLNQMVLL